MKMKCLLLVQGIIPIATVLFLCALPHRVIAKPPTPKIMVPKLTVPVTLDGKLDSREWKDAARVKVHDWQNTLRVQDGNLEKGDISQFPETCLSIKYDEKAIWIGAFCKETQAGYPQAFARGAMDDLSLDDAIGVVLGVRDHHEAVREIQQMGGYVGALGTESARADHYYQFTVNAIGVKSRTYNETPLPRPRFEGFVAKTQNGWSVEMRIPWDSFSVEGFQDKGLYINLFRYRPPVTMGWYLPHFGGYYPMPLGRMVLLQPQQAERKTIEPPRKVNSQNKTIENQIKGKISYHPLSGAIVATITQTQPQAGLTACFEVDGLESKTTVLTAKAKTVMVLDIKPGDQPQRHATLVVHDQSQKERVRAERMLSKVTAPKWLGTQVGMDYVDKRICQPWTRPLVKGPTVKLLDKTIGFGAFGLYNSIVDQWGELLGEPSQVVVEINGNALVLKAKNLKVSPEGNGVRVTSVSSAGSLQLETRSFLDYDGFTVVKMKLTGKETQQVSRFSVRFAILPDKAKYIYRILTQDTKALTGFGYAGNAGSIWVGNENKGLSFNFDTSPFLSGNLRHQIRLIQTPDRTWLELNFVDSKGQMPEGNIFRFFLQPTPTKPVSLVKANRSVKMYWEKWSDWQGYPDVAKAEMIKKWADKAHRKGKAAVLYTFLGLAENAPGFQEFKEDLMGQPAWIAYRRRYNPGKNVACYYTCKRGPEGDLLLWGMDKLAREAKIDGIVSDGLANIWQCKNPGHRYGCGQAQTIVWEKDLRSNVVETRRFLKRMRGLFEDAGRKVKFVAHTGGAICINTLSFIDNYMEGEQLSRFRPGYQIPTPTYAVGYNGYPWGFRSIFWEKTWRRTRGPFWSLTYALLHDNEIQGLNELNHLYDGFEDDAQTTYYPYWRDGPHVQLVSQHAKVSYYRKKNEALVVVGNLDFRPDEIQLDFKKLFPSHSVSVSEMLTGTRIKTNIGIYKTTLGGYQCLVLKVRKLNPSQKAEASRTWQANEYHPQDWKLTGPTGGVKRIELASQEKSRSVKISSMIWRNEARLTFTANPMTPNGYAKLRIHHTNRFRISFGKASLYRDSGRWHAKGFALDVGKLFQPMVVNDRLVPVEISIHENRVDVVYNGQSLACGLPIPNKTPQSLTLSTWGGDQFTAQPILLQSTPKKLYSGGIGPPRLLISQPVPPFKITSYKPNDWTLKNQAKGDDTPNQIQNKDGIYLISAPPGNPAAQAVLKNHTVGSDATIILSVTFKNRLRLKIGPVNLIHDGRWRVQGPLNGWSTGKTYQQPHDPKHAYRLTISLRKGVLDILVDGVVLVAEKAFDLSASGNQISLSTWAGDSVYFKLIEISTFPKNILRTILKHPIL